MKPSLIDLTPDEIAQELGLRPFQGKQLFRWIHQRRVFDFDRMTDLSKALRQTLKDGWTGAQLCPVEIAESSRSGTRKVLFRLADGETVEAVLLRHGRRMTLCLSTQVGCPVACTFCATGAGGYRRDLAPGEIVEQALHLLAGEDLGEKTPNIVYMGMGEPFLNYKAVVRSIRLMMEPDGLGIGARKITVSTVGHVPGIRRFARERWQVRLSVSLHAANDALRSKLVPMNQTYPLDRLSAALRDYQATAGRQLSLEWTLLNGVNDAVENAEELAVWMRALKASVNVIPYNAVPGLPYAPPPRERCDAFCSALRDRGITATLREERGQDIDAACGQLRCRRST